MLPATHTLTHPVDPLHLDVNNDDIVVVNGALCPGDKPNIVRAARGVWVIVGKQ